jgi:YidC/Oxa1 family membrane protein insertase
MLGMRGLATTAVTENASTPATDSVEDIMAAATTIVTDAVVPEHAIETVSSGALQIGDLKAMGLVHYTPVGALEAILEAVHVWTGLPWWGTIVATTVAIRTLLLPLVVKLQRNTARLHNIRPEMDRIGNKLKRAQADRDHVAVMQYTHELQELLRKHDANPLKVLLVPFLQAPVMISFYLALRDMAALPVPQFSNGGALWFTDLTAADPYYALPILSGLGFLVTFELGRRMGTTPSTMTKGTVLFFRAAAVGMIPLTATFPSAILVYWVASNVFSIFQTIGIYQPAVRRMLNIPDLVKQPPAFVRK